MVYWKRCECQRWHDLWEVKSVGSMLREGNHYLDLWKTLLVAVSTIIAGRLKS